MFKNTVMKEELVAIWYGAASKIKMNLMLLEYWQKDELGNCDKFDIGKDFWNDKIGDNGWEMTGTE